MFAKTNWKDVIDAKIGQHNTPKKNSVGGHSHQSKR